MLNFLFGVLHLYTMNSTELQMPNIQLLQDTASNYSSIVFDIRYYNQYLFERKQKHIISSEVEAFVEAQLCKL